MQKALSFNGLVILFVKRSHYRIYFWYISKDEAVSILNNANLCEKSGSLLKYKKIIFFLFRCEKWILIRKNEESMQELAWNHYHYQDGKGKPK